MKKMTKHEAKETIRQTICSSSKCNDSCLYGKNRCPYDMAMEALEEVEKYRKFGTVEELEKGDKILTELRQTLLHTQMQVDELMKMLGAT